MLHELIGFGAVALAMGLRHGVDADHIATIDGLTRSAGSRANRAASRCGLLFSVGHGVIVAIMATALTISGNLVSLPPWLRQSGAWIAVTILLLLGCFNLITAWNHQQGGSAAPASMRGWLASRLLARQGPAAAATSWATSLATGAMFALSLDTVAAAAFMSAAAIQLDASWVAPLLAVTFVAGMAIVDGAVGWWSAWLLRRAHGQSVLAPAVSALAIGLGCFITAATIVTHPPEAINPEAWGLSVSAFVWALVPLSYLTILALETLRRRHSPLAKPGGNAPG